MECKTDALLLKTVNLGESDKLATLLTADRGKISASFKGVRKSGAKLQFAAQPFCFAEYVLVSKGGRNTVVGASLHDGFWYLREDVAAYYAAACVTEACDKLLYEGTPAKDALVAAVRALSEMEEDVPSALLRFLLTAVTQAGYPIQAEACPICGKMPKGRLAFDMGSGSFTCRECSDGVPTMEITYRTIRAVREGGRGEGDGPTRALRLLRAYLRRQTETDLISLAQYLELAGGLS